MDRIIKNPEVSVAIFSEGGITKIRLLDDVRFEYQGREYTIPAGYVSDGMSTPRLLWPVISPCIDASTLLPSAQHDWLYDEHIGTRAEADAYYRRELIKKGMGALKALIVYCSLRLFGWMHW